MTAPDPRPAAPTIAERLDLLEARTRWTRWVGASALGVVMAAVVFIRLNPGGLVVARSFIVVDDAGRTRAILTADDAAGGAPALTLIDAAGRARAAVDATGLVVVDEQARTRAAVRVPPDGGPPHVGLAAPGGSTVLAAGAGPQAPAGLRLTGADPTGGAVVALPGNGQPGLELTDSQTHCRTLFTLTPDGLPRLVLHDRDGREVFAAP
jgi:hypothetical protein